MQDEIRMARRLSVVMSLSFRYRNGLPRISGFRRRRESRIVAGAAATSR